MDYEQRKAQEIAERTQRSDTRKALAHALAGNLETLTGRPWSVEIRQDGESSYCPNEFYSAKLTEAETGVALHMSSAGWNEQEKVSFSVSVPVDPVTQSARGFGSCPGIPYGRHSPETKANANRPPMAIAKQIVAKVLTEESREALAALAALDAERMAENDAAAQWRDAVAEAAGIAAHFTDYADRIAWHNRGAPYWAKIESTRHRTGGKLEIELPEDPQAAAAMVAAIRAIVEGDTGDRQSVAELAEIAAADVRKESKA